MDEQDDAGAIAQTPQQHGAQDDANGRERIAHDQG